MPDLKGDESADTEAKTKYQKILEKLKKMKRNYINF